MFTVIFNSFRQIYKLPTINVVNIHTIKNQGKSKPVKKPNLLFRHNTFYNRTVIHQRKLAAAFSKPTV